MAIDRRRHRRYVVQIDTAVELVAEQRSVTGKLTDISAGGAFILAPVTAEQGWGAFIRFTYQQESLCEATGTVVRILPFGGQTGIGIEFAVANDALLTFLYAYGRAAEAVRPDYMAAISDVQLRLP